MFSQLNKIPDHSSLQENPDQLEFTLENLRTTADHWNAFFKEISEHMIEREDLIGQTQLALLAKEHLLMLGHPGTAKSQLSKLVLRRIVKPDGTSTNFERQLGLESRKGDLLGPVLPETRIKREGNEEIHETKLIHQLAEGLRDFHFLSLDELFDAPPGVIRDTCITALVDRILALGKENVNILLKTAFATTNKTMEALRSTFKTELDAIFDRFAFIYWTVQRPLRSDSPKKILAEDWERRTGKKEGKKEGLKIPPLFTSELNLLNDLVDHVMSRFKKNASLFDSAAEFYYIFQQKLDDREEEFGEGQKRSKLGSARSLGLLNPVLPAIAVRRWMKDHSSPLMVTPDDFKELKSFMIMRGPSVFDLPSDLDTIKDDEDRKMLDRMKIEEECFTEAFNVIWPKLQASRRAVPQNFPPIKAKVIEYTNKLIGMITPAEIANGLHYLHGKLDDLQIFSSQTTEGEEIYAIAVSTYLSLLAKHLEIFPLGINNAVSSYNSVKSHIENFETGLYSSLVNKAEADFKKALARAYNPQNPQFPSKYEEIRNLLADVIQHADILGAEIVSAIQSIIRGKALELITGAPSPSFEDYRDVYELYREIAKNGIDGHFPLEKLFDVHARLLIMLRDLILGAQNYVRSQQGANQYVNVLTIANQSISEYKKSLLKDEFALSKGLKLPEDLLNAYVAKQLQDKKTHNSNGELSAKIESSSDSEISIKWTKTSVEKMPLEHKDRERYESYCMSTLLENEEMLLKVPAVSHLFNKILNHAKLYCHTAWNEEMKQMIQDEYVSSVRSCILNKKTEIFMWPFTLKIHGTEVRMRDREILFDELFDDVSEYARTVIHTDEVTAARFLIETVNIPPTQKNINAFRDFANQDTESASPTEIEIENSSSETEKIPMTDVIQQISADHKDEWKKLHEEVETALNELGQLTGKIIMQNQVSTLPAAGTISDPDEFIEKYSTFFDNADQNNSWKLQFEHIPISFASTDEVIDSMKKDLFAMVAHLSADDLIDFAPSLEGISAFIKSKNIDFTMLFADCRPLVAEKMESYIKTRVQQFTEADKQFTQEFVISGDSAQDFAVVQKMAQGFIDEIIAKEELEAIEDARMFFNLDEQSVKEYQTQIASAGLKIILNLIEKAVEIVAVAELTDVNFKMSDLNTITSENYEKVRDSLKEKGFFKTMDTWISSADTWAQEYNDLIDPQLIQRLVEVKEKKDALKNAYLSKMISFEGANI